MNVSDELRERLCLVKGYLGKLGKSKELLDLIDLDIDLQQAVGTFGSFIKYVVDEEREREADLSGPSAFSVLMSSQRALCQWKLSGKITKENKTKKDVLYNDITSFETQQLKWKSSEVDSSGINLVRSLTECLWYIDGHHHVFEEGIQYP